MAGRRDIKDGVVEGEVDGEGSVGAVVEGELVRRQAEGTTL